MIIYFVDIAVGHCMSSDKEMFKDMAVLFSCVLRNQMSLHGILCTLN